MVAYSKAIEVSLVVRNIIEDFRKDLTGVVINSVFRDSVIMNKTKEIWARIYKIPAIYAYLLDNEGFVLEVWGDGWKALSDEGRGALVAHELRHIKVDYDSKGEMVLNLIPHDFEEFEEIIDRYGFWKKDLKRLKEIVINKEKLGGLKRKNV